VSQLSFSVEYGASPVHIESKYYPYLYFKLSRWLDQDNDAWIAPQKLPKQLY
jgi:hypothetical protein